MELSTIRQLFDQLVDKLANKRGIEPLPLQFHWRRIYILPSKPGLFLALIWGLMLMAGLNFNNNLALILVFMVFAIGHIALYLTFFNMKDIYITQINSAAVFAEEMITSEIFLSAQSDKEDIQIEGFSDKNKSTRITSRTQGKLLLQTKAIKRGWQKIPRIKIYSRYPLGLFTAWIMTQPKLRTMVYPKPESPCPEFPQDDGYLGMKMQKNKGEDVDNMRVYRPGDPVRDIAWKKTAQQDQTIVKEYNNQKGKQLVFNFSLIKLKHTEEKLSRLTAWVIKAKQQGVKYQLILPKYESTLNVGSTHLQECLRALALHGINLETD